MKTEIQIEETIKNTEPVRLLLQAIEACRDEEKKHARVEIKKTGNDMEVMLTKKESYEFCLECLFVFFAEIRWQLRERGFPSCKREFIEDAEKRGHGATLAVRQLYEGVFANTESGVAQ